ncbi:hypothetical protein BCV69DRAFT_314150 [Microstroma glucosiphilum]|uniref:Uncharacterized protein n=1 Tax=Pseudomicrostroma glucosiphilum TaxID=1684307 RepID=A0A316U2B2_9BASI|nr:hypothetical protein BCV69DRAFT_314150 [Pseudomicrostroma glucosiphilum]PWN18954.1 hypothetical protein BCV69DRAFT_314150 [Pseudomicrostroma glucosiphilum]
MPVKRKAERESTGSCDKKVKESTGGYTTENERAILMALTKLALENCRRIAESPGTGEKSTSAMNMKVRSMMKPPKRPDIFDEDDGEQSSNEDQKTDVKKCSRSKTPSPKKKVKAESGGASPGRAAANAWSKEEEGAAFRAAAELALANLPLIIKAPGLEARNLSQLSHKFRSMLKSLDKANAWGDGKWVDDFKIAKKQG